MSPAPCAGSLPGPRSEWPHDAPVTPAFRACARWGGTIAVEIINSEAGGRRQEPRHGVSGRNPALLPIAEVLSRRAAGTGLLDGREPADFTAGHVPGSVSIGLRGSFEECPGPLVPPHRY